MLEHNTTRMLLLIIAIIILGAILLGVFVFLFGNDFANKLTWLSIKRSSVNITLSQLGGVWRGLW